MKIIPVGAELLYAERSTDEWTDRQTNMTKLIVAFHNVEDCLKIFRFGLNIRKENKY